MSTLLERMVLRGQGRLAAVEPLIPARYASARSDPPVGPAADGVIPGRPASPGAVAEATPLVASPGAAADSAGDAGDAGSADGAGSRGGSRPGSGPRADRGLAAADRHRDGRRASRSSRGSGSPLAADAPAFTADRAETGPLPDAARPDADPAVAVPRPAGGRPPRSEPSGRLAGRTAESTGPVLPQAADPAGPGAPRSLPRSWLAAPGPPRQHRDAPPIRLPELADIGDIGGEPARPRPAESRSARRADGSFPPAAVPLPEAAGPLTGKHQESAAGAQPSGAPALTITIGHIEVHPAAPGRLPAGHGQPAGPARPPFRPQLSLADFLGRTEDGAGGTPGRTGADGKPGGRR